MNAHPTPPKLLNPVGASLGVPPVYEWSKDVEVIQVVRTTLLRRGEGVAGDPVRRVEQFWSLDGRLLAENDDWADKEESPS